MIRGATKIRPMINVNQALETHEIIINKLGGPYGLEYITTPRRLIWLF
jgi:hypothetical protein